MTIIAVLAAACSGSDGDGSTDTAVRPFTDVQSSEMVFEVDPDDPSRALFHVTTTIPMICSITWGSTESLGNQNNSLTMDGTGIEQHDVVLPGAQAGEEYFFTVQGADAEGTLYRSELLSVTIPETGSAVFDVGSDTFSLSEEGGPPTDVAPTTTDPRTEGRNLSLDATVVDVSSEFGESFAAEAAIDGDLSTEWSTEGDGDEAFIEFDLGDTHEIAGVEFVTRTMADDSATTSMFTVMVDDETFGPFDAATVRTSRFVPLSDGTVTGQMVRFEVDSSSGGNTGAVEIRIFAPVG
ncbi:MAG: discoidin domain-containing protein [Acidimicrobiales bacterium]